MPWVIEILSDPKAVASTVVGPMKLVMVKELAAASIKAAREHGAHNFYTDERQAEPEMSTLEIHALPELLGSMGLGRQDKVAVLYAASAPRADDFRFFETAALNRGYAVRLFTDPQEALRWLRRA